MKNYTHLTLYFDDGEYIVFPFESISSFYIDKIHNSIYCPYGSEVIFSEIADYVKVVIEKSASNLLCTLTDTLAFDKILGCGEIDFLEIENRFTEEYRDIVVAKCDDKSNSFHSIQLMKDGSLEIVIERKVF